MPTRVPVNSSCRSDRLQRSAGCSLCDAEGEERSDYENFRVGIDVRYAGNDVGWDWSLEPMDPTPDPATVAHDTHAKLVTVRVSALGTDNDRCLEFIPVEAASKYLDARFQPVAASAAAFETISFIPSQLGQTGRYAVIYPTRAADLYAADFSVPSTAASWLLTTKSCCGPRHEAALLQTAWPDSGIASAPPWRCWLC